MSRILMAWDHMQIGIRRLTRKHLRLRQENTFSIDAQDAQNDQKDEPLFSETFKESEMKLQENDRIKDAKSKEKKHISVPVKRYRRKYPYCIKIGELKKGLVRLGVKVSLQTIRRRDKEIKPIHDKGVVIIHHGEEKKIDEVRYYNEKAVKRATRVFNVDMEQAKKLFKKLSNRG